VGTALRQGHHLTTTIIFIIIIPITATWG